MFTSTIATGIANISGTATGIVTFHPDPVPGIAGDYSPRQSAAVARIARTQTRRARSSRRADAAMRARLADRMAAAAIVTVRRMSAADRDAMLAAAAETVGRYGFDRHVVR